MNEREAQPSLRGRFEVRVPASTSNLGPGFDFLGLCLGLFVEASATQRAAPAGEHRVSYGTPPAWRECDDLVLRSLRAYEDRAGQRLPALDVLVASEIPVGRGFGSSGAAIAAGLLLAAAVEGRSEALERREEWLVPLGLALDGHPDNASASLIGGCTLSVPHGGGVTVVRQAVDPSLGFAVAWPESPLFTEEARRVLPENVPLADAVENPRRLALLLEGLRRGDGALIRLGTVDRLHERFRRQLVPGSDEACERALEAGAFAACLSGAGSGLVAIAPRRACQAVAAALASPLQGGQGRSVEFVSEAPRVARA